MKDISPTLRRIDEEITATRQQIAALQVNIVRLEDARRVFMGMAEADQAHREAGGRAELLAPGSHARPQLIVRPTGSSEINGKPFKRKRRRKRPQGTVRAQLEKGIVAALADGATLTSTEVADQIGIPPGNHERHPLREALRFMLHDGQLIRSGAPRHYTYRLKGEAPQ